MPPTRITAQLIKDGDVGRSDLNITTSGEAVVRKLVQGAGITLSSTGADSGTGDVTINTADTLPAVVLQSKNSSKTLSANTPQNKDLLTLLPRTFGDLLSFKNPTNVEYYDDSTSAFVTWAQSFSVITNQKGYGLNVSIDYTHRKFRLTYDTGATYNHVLALLIGTEHQGGQYLINSFIYETSPDNSTWNNKGTFTNVSSAWRALLFPSGDIGADRYIRFTIEFGLSSGQTMYIHTLSAFSQRAPMTSFLPFTWDNNKILSVSGITASGNIQGNYKSSDGTDGISTQVWVYDNVNATDYRLTFKDGILVDVFTP